MQRLDPREISPIENQDPSPILPFVMKDIPSEFPRGWELELNNMIIKDVYRLTMTHGRLGLKLDYGLRPEGFDGPTIEEPGGSIVVPYTFDKNGNIFVGLVNEYRPLLGGFVDNIPRGLADPHNGESRKETAVRELREEMGLKLNGSAIVELANGLNANTTFFDTSKSEQTGISIHAVKVDVTYLEALKDEEGKEYFIFPQEVRDNVRPDEGTELITGSKFVDINDINTRDILTLAAVGALTKAFWSGTLPYDPPFFSNKAEQSVVQ